MALVTWNGRDEYFRTFYLAGEEEVYSCEAWIGPKGLSNLKIWDSSDSLIHQFPPTSFASPQSIKWHDAALEYLGLSSTEGGCIDKEDGVGDQVREEEVGKVTDYKFVDWDVSKATLKEADQVAASIMILVGQLYRKDVEIRRGIEDCAVGFAKMNASIQALASGEPPE